MRCGCHSHNGLVRSPSGLAQREIIRPEVLAVEDSQLYLDVWVSVSGLELERDTLWLPGDEADEQYRRFLDGS